jgi:ribonuclease J
MTSLTFYGGVNEIGGNKILLEDEGTRIFLDFGMSFNAANRYFSEFLQPRKCNGIMDFVEFGLLPMDQKIRGIYRKDFLRRCGIKEKEPSIDGVILSHAHLDHSAYISHLSEEIPIYCGSLTKLILKAMQDTGSGSFNDYVAYNENFVLRQKERGEGMTKVKGRVRDRNVKTFSSGDRIKIGEIVIQPMGVDHSIPDSYGFIIQTNKGNIVYTGDLRFHGYKRNRTEEFVKRASQSEPIALICEGTNINKEKGIGEGEVKEKINEIVSHAKGLVIANFPPRDLDRMRTFYEVAKENGRKLIINMKQAYLLKLLENEGNGVISLKDENVRIYIPRKNWGVITDPSFPREIAIQD